MRVAVLCAQPARMQASRGVSFLSLSVSAPLLAVWLAAAPAVVVWVGARSAASGTVLRRPPGCARMCSQVWVCFNKQGVGEPAACLFACEGTSAGDGLQLITCDRTHCRHSMVRDDVWAGVLACPSVLLQRAGQLSLSLVPVRRTRYCPAFATRLAPARRPCCCSRSAAPPASSGSSKGNAKHHLCHHHHQQGSLL